MKIYFDDTWNPELEGTFIELTSGLAFTATQIAFRGYQSGILTPDEIDDFVVKMAKEALVMNRCILANKYPDKFSYLKPKDSDKPCTLRRTNMQHFYIRKVGILLAKSAFLLCGLGGIWLMLSLVEPSGVYPWWLVVLTSVGAFALGCVFLLGALIAEVELEEDMARAKHVPVRKIDRRHSA